MSAKKNIQLFARLAKVDEAKRTVTGVMASEMPDHVNEVFDYDTSKAYFQQWSDSVAKATNGASVGNVRVMHGNSVAGKLLAMMFDDAAKTIEVTAEVVDDNEWKKVLKGCYAGFSIGGKYINKWDDGALKRYTAKPNEVSLVDMPCIPDALFDVGKADAEFDLLKTDGSHELRKFVTDATQGDSSAQEGAGAAQVASVTLPEAVAKAFAPDGVPEGVDVLSAVRAYAFVNKFADNTDQAAQIQAVDVVLQKAMGDKYRGELSKGMWNVRELAYCFDNLACVTDNARYEAVFEGDASKVPAMLRTALQSMGEALIAMCAEEVNEVLATVGKVTTVTDEPLAKGVDGLQEQLLKVAEMPLEDVRKAYETALRIQASWATSLDNMAKALGLPGHVDGTDYTKRAEAAYAAITAVAKHVHLPEGRPWTDILGLIDLDESEQLGKVNKAMDEASTALRKTITERDTALAKVAALETEVAQLKAAPAADPKLAKLKAVDKGEEINPLTKAEPEPIKDNDGNVDAAATAMKKALAADPTFILGR